MMPGEDDAIVLGPAGGLELHKACDAAIRRLNDTVESLRADNEEYDELFGLLRPLMLGTVNALKGDPGPRRLHDQSDLPRVAARVVGERDALRAAVEDAVGVLGGEDNDYDEWSALLGRLRAALEERT